MNNAMLILREEGMSNRQIAERLGISYCSVLKNIGIQSKALTRANIKAGKAYNRAKQLIAAQERERIINVKYDALAMELEAHNAAIADIRAKMAELKPNSRHVTAKQLSLFD